MEIHVTFAELFLHLSEDDKCVGEQSVAKVTSADRGSSSGGGAEVDLTAPVALYEEFSAKYVGLNQTRIACKSRLKLPPLYVFNYFFQSVGPLFEDKV